MKFQTACRKNNGWRYADEGAVNSNFKSQFSEHDEKDLFQMDLIVLIMEINWAVSRKMFQYGYAEIEALPISGSGCKISRA